jgi:molecular chaperone DnaJ
MKRDYYEILGVQRDADEGAIKRAYRQAALKFHPDRNPDDSQAEERFKEATEAYEVLRDPELRGLYDRYGHDGVKAGVRGGGGGFGGFSTFDEALNIFMREFGGFGFQDIFGAGRRGRARSRGADVKIRIALTLEDVMRGAKKTVRMPVARCSASSSASVPAAPVAAKAA